MKAIIEFEVKDEDDFERIKEASELPNERWFLEYENEKKPRITTSLRPMSKMFTKMQLGKILNVEEAKTNIAVFGQKRN